MVLFHLERHKANSVSFDKVFLVKGNERKENLCLASSIREAAIVALNEEATHSRCINVLQSYLPYVSSLSVQIEHTRNLDMSSKLCLPSCIFFTDMLHRFEMDILFRSSQPCVLQLVSFSS